MTTAASGISFTRPIPTSQLTTSQERGRTFNVWAQTFKEPAHTVVNQTIRCFTRLHGTACSQCVEGAKRVGAFVTCCAGVYFFPIYTSIVLGGLGGAFLAGVALDMRGDKLTEKKYTELKGDILPQCNSSRSRTLFSMNVNMFWISYAFGGTGPAAERIPALAQKIDYKNTDVVVLQEMSFKNARALWHQGMKKYYATAITRVFPSPWTDFDANLFIALKEPLVKEPICESWPSADAFKRGMLCVETEHYAVIDSHLQSKTEAVHVQLRALHATKLREAYEKLEQSGKIVIACIDGNMCRTKKEFEEHITPYFYDAFTGPYTAENATCTDEPEQYMWGRKSATSYEWIDYVLISHSMKKKVNIQLEQVKGFDRKELGKAVSDHNGFRAKFSW